MSIDSSSSKDPVSITLPAWLVVFLICLLIPTCNKPPSKGNQQPPGPSDLDKANEEAGKPRVPKKPSPPWKRKKKAIEIIRGHEAKTIKKIIDDAEKAIGSAS